MLIKGKDRKPSFFQCFFYGIAFICLIFFSPATALAHKVYIYAWFDGDVVHTESYFGSKKVKEGRIQVFDISGKKLLEGRTDEKGEFAFKAPQEADLRIVVDAGMGHRNECILKREEVETMPGVDPEPVRTSVHKSETLPRKELDTQQIRAVVEQIIDSRLKPIQRELARIRKDEGPSFTEVAGGIGYILGLMGLIMYFKSRRK
jgi:nickel transport protein